MAASSASSPVSLVVVNSATGDWRLDIINPAATDETVTLSMPMHPDGDETGRTWSATTQMTTGLAASGIDEIDVSFTLAAHGKVTFSGRSTFADGAKRVSILYTSTLLAKTYLGYINFFFTDDRRPIANDVDLPKNFFDEHALTQTDLDGFFNGRWTMSEVISYLRSNQNSTAFNPDGLTIEVIGDQATVNMANAVIGALAENTPIAIDSFTVGLAVSLNDGSLHPVYLGDVYDTAADALALAGTKQAADATLTALAGLATQADTMIYFSGTDAAALISVSSFFRSIMVSADAAAVRSNIGVAIGSQVQAYDADLAAIAALSSAADKMPYATGAQAWALADLTAAGRALLDDADAAAQRTTLGLGTAATQASTAFQAAGSGTGLPWEMEIALSDETTAVTTGDAKMTFRMPCAVTLNAGNAGVRLSCSTASSSGLPTVDVNENGSTILSTKVTLDANEKTSLTAATAVVISDTSLADDAEITVDVDVAGTGCKGLKLLLRGVRA